MTPKLAPIGWTQFISVAPADADMAAVDMMVNERIVPRDADATKPWRIIHAEDHARDGCCHDYAVTKRAELMGLGWSASRLLLAEVAYDEKEDHMVLIAIDSAGLEWSLDNLQTPMPWNDAGYRLIRRQSAANPNLWEG